MYICISSCLDIVGFFTDMKELESKLALSNEIIETSFLVKEKREKVDV